MNAHTTFLICGLFFGLIYFLFVPPFQSPDEFNHFYKAYQISEGKFISEKNINRLGGTMPSSIEEFYSTFRLAAANPDFRFKWHHISETFDIPIKNDSIMFADFANTSNYSPISYLPQAVVINILRFFNAPLGLIYYTVRLVVFLFVLITFYYCIKITPVFKWLFVLLALLPINLFIANSFSADNVTNIISFLWIVSIFKFTFTDNPLSIKYICWLVLLAALLPLAKLVYIGLLFLLFILPKEKFKSRTYQYLIYCVVLLPSCILFFWWLQIVSGNYISYNNYHPNYRVLTTLAPESDYIGQLNIILSQPLYFLKVIFKSIFNPYQHYLHTYIASFGTHLYHNLPLWIWLPFYGIIIIVSLSCETCIVFSARQKLFLFLGALSSFLLLLLTVHLIWDPVGSGYVWLIQGRYLIPIFPLLFILIGDVKRIHFNFLKPTLLVSVLFVHCACFYILYKIHYKQQFIKVREVLSGFEKTDTKGNFYSNDALIKFTNQNNKTNIIKRHGEHSALVVPGGYGLTCSITKILAGDVIELELWKKGKGGEAVLTGGGQNCKMYYAGVKSYILIDKNDWQKLYYRLQITEPCDSSYLTFFVANPGTDNSYFDDLIITHYSGHIDE